MIHTEIVPENTDIHLALPADFVGKGVEIIAFTSDEGLWGFAPNKRVVTFNATTLDTEGFKLDREEANER